MMPKINTRGVLRSVLKNPPLSFMLRWRKDPTSVDPRSMRHRYQKFTQLFSSVLIDMFILTVISIRE